MEFNDRRAPKEDDGDYDENLQPSDKPGMVDFGGKKLPALSFHRGEFSHSFTTPLENGAIASVSYFHKQKLTNVALMHAQPPGRSGQVHLRVAGVVGPDGKDQDTWEKGIADVHGDRKPDMPRSTEEAVDDLEYYSKRKIPKHIQEDNRKNMGTMSQQWGWKP